VQNWEVNGILKTVLCPWMVVIFSIVLMAIVNAKYEFIMVDVGLGANGRIFRMEE